jgi:DNA-binding NarL/FixJ family response regulator
MIPLRILLVDDHALVRAGISSLLRSLEGVTVVSECEDGRAAVSAVREHNPDMVLMDVAMGGLNGLEATRLIVKEFPAVRVMILSMFANEEYVASALSAGAKGYLLKNATPSELQFALQTVASGETYLTPAVSKTVIEQYKNRLAQKPDSLERLTPRQREVLQLIAEGNTSKEIASRLNLSVKTIDMHRTMLMKELNIRDIAGLVRFAIRTGLITSD